MRLQTLNRNRVSRFGNRIFGRQSDSNASTPKRVCSTRSNHRIEREGTGAGEKVILNECLCNEEIGYNPVELPAEWPREKNLCHIVADAQSWFIAHPTQSQQWFQ